MRIGFKLIFTVIASSAILGAQAAAVSSLQNAITYDVPSDTVYMGGNFSFSPDITWSAESPSSFVGATPYGFGTNGQWLDYMFATNTANTSMTITFANPVQGVAAFFNYSPNPDWAPATISVYNTKNQLIESTILNFQTAGGWDQGEIHGFYENTADIGSFKMSGSFIAAKSLQVAAVPEPESYAMLLAGLGLIGAAVKRRKTK